MYVIKNGKLVEDTIIEAFRNGWKLYELCQQDDTMFVKVALQQGFEVEKSIELLAMLKEAKGLI